MKESPLFKAAIPAIIMVAVLLITAFFAAGVLRESLENVPIEVDIVKVDTEVLIRTSEHDPLPAMAIGRAQYDLGIRLRGNQELSGVILKFSISLPGISTLSVEALYYNETTDPHWRPLTFIDQGDMLVTSLGPAGGYVLDEDFDLLTYLLITFEMGGPYVVNAWYEILG